MACKVRINITKYKLPLNHRWLNKSWYLNQTLYKAWRFHLYAHNLQVEDVVFRKIVYDAIYDALVNEYDKVRHRDFLQEYAKFQQYWNENFSHLNERIIEWENYRQSGKYQYFLEQLKHIRRFDKRVQAALDNALAFMYAKFQKKFVIAETLEKIEKRLGMDVWQKAWSKKWLWFAAYMLVFDACDLYAATLGKTKHVIRDYDAELGEVLKVNIERWYERKELAVDYRVKMLMRTYENIIIPIVGEVGSVALAEAARRGTCIALLHTARMLANFAISDPRLKLLTWGAQLLGNLVQILNNSVLAWLGWQIGVEWTLDSTIQSFLNEAIKHVYATFTGKNIWKIEHWVDWGLFDLACYYQYLKYVNGQIRADQQELIDLIYQQGSDKQKQILDRIARTIQVAQSLYNFKKFFWQTEKKFLDEAKNLLDAAMNREEDFYYMQTNYLTEQFLEGWVKQKAKELEKVQDDIHKGKYTYEIVVKDSRDEYTDQNGFKHTKYGFLRKSYLKVFLYECWPAPNWHAYDVYYVDNFQYSGGLDVAEKEEYNIEKAKEFIGSLLNRAKIALYWRYGIREMIREKDLFKLPLLFLIDLIRPRITKKCVSVIYQHKRFFKYVLDYDNSINGKTLTYRYYKYKNYSDLWMYTFIWPANQECEEEVVWEENFYAINGARLVSKMYKKRNCLCEIGERYSHDFHTSFSSAEVGELKISFGDWIVWEQKHGRRWTAGAFETKESLELFLNELPIKRYTLRPIWGSPSKTYKKLSKRSKLVCY